MKTKKAPLKLQKQTIRTLRAQSGVRAGHQQWTQQSNSLAPETICYLK